MLKRENPNIMDSDKDPKMPKPSHVFNNQFSKNQSVVNISGKSRSLRKGIPFKNLNSSRCDSVTKGIKSNFRNLRNIAPRPPVKESPEMVCGLEEDKLNHLDFILKIAMAKVSSKISKEKKLVDTLGDSNPVCLNDKNSSSSAMLTTFQRTSEDLSDESYCSDDSSISSLSEDNIKLKENLKDHPVINKLALKDKTNTVMNDSFVKSNRNQITEENELFARSQKEPVIIKRKALKNNLSISQNHRSQNSSGDGEAVTSSSGEIVDFGNKGKIIIDLNAFSVSKKPEGRKELCNKIAKIIDDKMNENVESSSCVDPDEVEVEAGIISNEVKSDEFESNEVGIESDDKDIEFDEVGMETDGASIESDEVGVESDKVDFEYNEIPFESDEAEIESDEVVSESDEDEIESDEVGIDSEEVGIESDEHGFESDCGETSSEIVKVNLPKLKSALKSYQETEKIYDKPEKNDNINAGASDLSSVTSQKMISISKRKKTVTFKDIESIPKEIQEIEENIERELEEKAVRAKLTATNVKNMIRAVLTNSEVLKLVDYSLNPTGEKPSYELKLTRAKTKQLAGLDSNPLFNRPPASKDPEIETLISQELPEEESDEEYEPHLELSEDEESKVSDCVFDEDDDVELNSSVISVASEDHSVTNIGQRTRSKLSLSQTPLEDIEQAFVPPDITTDMYNTHCDNEDWANFLKEFMQPLDPLFTENNDDENDPEYNVMNDEETEATDKEELRADRAVKVTKKELNDLMNEISEYTSMLSSDEEDGKPESLPVQIVDQESEIVQEEIQLGIPKFDDTQYLILTQQLRQHVQLLTQTCLLVYGLPYDYSFYYEEARNRLYELDNLRRNNENPSYNILNLESSLRLIDQWIDIVDSKDEIRTFLDNELDKIGTIKINTNRKVRYRPELPGELVNLCLESDAFPYPLFLPPSGFTDFSLSVAPMFLSEDILIIIGLDEFSEFLDKDPNVRSDLTQIVSYVNHYLMPSRKHEMIIHAIRKNLKSGLNNIFKEYFYRGKVPQVDHFVVVCQNLIKLCDNPLKNLPEKWQEYLKSYKEETKS